MFKTNSISSPPKVSVVTPVYNGSNYLHRCFDSIKSQDYTNLEWVIVDDGSNDNTVELIQNLKLDYSWIKLIQQENSGPAKARRNAVLNSDGSYVVYLDIDDTISDNAINSAMENFDDGIDVVLFRKIIKEDDGSEREVNTYTENWPQKGLDVFEACIDGWGAHSYGIYRKEIFLEAYNYIALQGQLSPTYKDELLTRLIFLNSKRISLCEGKYYYDLNEGSVSKKVNKDYYKIAENYFCLEVVLRENSVRIPLERLSSKIMFDMLSRFFKWYFFLDNKKEWLGMLHQISYSVSLKKELCLDNFKSRGVKVAVRVLIILLCRLLKIKF